MKKLILLPLLALSILFANAQTKQNNFEISKSIDIYNNVLRVLNNSYVDEISPSELNETAINAMLEDLDPYTVFIPESQMEDVRLMTTGEYGGIGATIQHFDNKTFIAEPYEGFPAAKAHLIPGDVFLEINGIDVSNKKSSEISELLKGQPGTTVTLKMQRYGETEPVTVQVKREKIKIDNIPYSTVLDNGIGYVMLSGFTKNCAKEVKEVFLDMKKNNELKGFIIDLRGNGGGLLNEAVDIVNMFVPKNKLVVYTKGKNNEEKMNYLTQHEPVDLEIPLVILVNETSASASEILSGSIQDFDRGVIVGQRTFGKGLVQRPFPLPDGSMIRHTTARYYTPSGRCIQRPYEKGHSEEYQMDMLSRYKSGELWHQDSVKIDSTQRYETLNNHRIVYGGGGIMPDAFVPADTSHYTPYYRDLMAKAVINTFVQDYLDKYRKELKKKFPNADEFYENFTAAPLISELVAAGEAAGVKLSDDNREQLETSRPLLEAIIKGLLERDLYESGSYIRNINPLRPDFTTALRIINDPAEYNRLLGNP